MLPCYGGERCASHSLNRAMTDELHAAFVGLTQDRQSVELNTYSPALQFSQEILEALATLPTGHAKHSVRSWKGW